MSVKPILFNTDMVLAILDGRKTVTRRVVKMRGYTPDEIGRKDYCGMINGLNDKDGLFAGFYKGSDVFTVDGVTHIDAEYAKSAYRPGDILYVRETWAQVNESIGMGLKTKKIIYRANYSDAEAEGWKWRPSIHMPREAARIFLRVTDVRVERLHRIKADECVSEGAVKRPDYTKRHDLVLHNRYRQEFAILWDSTIKLANLEKYGWAANPWVWVICFERCEKPDEFG